MEENTEDAEESSAATVEVLTEHPRLAADKLEDFAEITLVSLDADPCTESIVQ